MNYLIVPEKDVAVSDKYAAECKRKQEISIVCRTRRTRADLYYDWGYLSQESQNVLLASTEESREFFESLLKRYPRTGSATGVAPQFMFIDGLLTADIEKAASEIYAFLSDILRGA